MGKEKLTMTLNFDLDGTLIDGNHSALLLQNCCIDPKKFFGDVDNENDENPSIENGAILYITRIIDEINYGRMRGLKIKDIKRMGTGIDSLVFPGVPECFEQLEKEFPSINFRRNIISQGLRDMIMGSELSTHFHTVNAYHLTTSKYRPGVIIGARRTVSSSEKENVK